VRCSFLVPPLLLTPSVKVPPMSLRQFHSDFPQRVGVRAIGRESLLPLRRPPFLVASRRVVLLLRPTPLLFYVFPTVNPSPPLPRHKLVDAKETVPWPGSNGMRGGIYAVTTVGRRWRLYAGPS